MKFLKQIFKSEPGAASLQPRDMQDRDTPVLRSRKDPIVNAPTAQNKNTSTKKQHEPDPDLLESKSPAPSKAPSTPSQRTTLAAGIASSPSLGASSVSTTAASSPSLPPTEGLDEPKVQDVKIIEMDVTLADLPEGVTKGGAESYLSRSAGVYPSCHPIHKLGAEEQARFRAAGKNPAVEAERKWGKGDCV